MIKVQIYILSRDRVNFLREAIKSAVSQKTKNVEFEVIISDNSIGETVETFVKSEYPLIKYIRRNPPTNVWEHYKIIITESTGDYIVLFHDDDILLENYLEEIYKEIENHPNASAIGCMANILLNKEEKYLEKINTTEETIIFESKKDFLLQYLRDDRSSIAPFPSYIYKRSSLNIENINENDGLKYADVSFLAKTIELGPIIWKNKKLITYRIHENNDSATFSVEGKRKLRIYMENNGFNRKDTIIRKYKLSTWYQWIFCEKIISKSPLPIIPKNHRQLKVLRALINMNFIKIYRLFFWRIILGCIFYKTNYKQ